MAIDGVIYKFELALLSDKDCIRRSNDVILISLPLQMQPRQPVYSFASLIGVNF
jgi:hypothetical protein